MNSRFSLLSIGIVLIMTATYFALKNSQFDPNVVLKPDTDSKEYKFLQLPNQLRVLLISNPEADKAAAALDVHIGNLRDPEHREGLAHFLEHMLFLGTKDFPEAGEYQEFITKHGGSHNAFTASEHTNYFFEIDKEYLAPALDRFSAFFKSPLFNSEYVDREKNAVHSEYQAKLKDDMRRNYEVIRSMFNQQHPASRFSVGALETLSDKGNQSIEQDLKDFYQKYYSANLMTLVVSGKEDLETLELWVNEKFNEVPNHQVQLEGINQPLFKEGTLPAKVFINPVKNTRTLSLMFPIKPLVNYYREKPTQYLSNLIGHEGKGSLLSLLKEQGLAEGLSAGSGFNALEYATFNVSIKLTEKGLAEHDLVVKEVFAYINMLKEEGPQQSIYEEQSSLNNIAFRFQESHSPSQQASSLAGNLHRYTPREVIRGPYLMSRFDHSLISRYTHALTPDNVLITVSAQNLPSDQTSKWYQTPYKVMPVSKEQVADWQVAKVSDLLHLPEENQFVPQHLELLAQTTVQTDKPEKLIDDEGYTLWHRTNLEYQSPKADIYINIRSPLANKDALAGITGNIYAKMINDQLNEFSYPAYLAGLDYAFYRNSRGITIKVSGYSEKLTVLLDKILDTSIKAELEQHRFDIYKEEMIRAYKNEGREKPYGLAYKNLVNLLMDSSWSLKQRMQAAQNVSLEDVKKYQDTVFNDIEVVVLTHGNLEKEEAEDIGKTLEERLLANSKITQVPAKTVVKLDQGKLTGYNLDTQHNDSVLLTYYQGAEKSDKERAYAGLLSQIISTPFYSEIRTEKQRGYIVFATPIPLAQVPGVALITQSHAVTPKVLANDYQSFLVAFKEDLMNMTDQEYAQHKQGIITKLREKPQRLSQHSDSYWQQIDQQQTGFDTKERLIAEIETINKSELVEFYDRFFFGAESRELIIQYQGQSIESDSPELVPVSEIILEADSFKAKQQRF